MDESNKMADCDAVSGPVGGCAVHLQMMFTWHGGLALFPPVAGCDTALSFLGGIPLLCRTDACHPGRQATSAPYILTKEV